MPIPVITSIEHIYLNIVKHILESRLNKGQCCLNEQQHDCINQLEIQKNHTIYLNIFEKETDHLFEKWTIKVKQDENNMVDKESILKFSQHISHFISNLPLSKTMKFLYVMTNLNDSQQSCYSYVSNTLYNNNQFKIESNLKKNHFNLLNILSIEIMYDENIDFISWSRMQQENIHMDPIDMIHPLSTNNSNNGNGNHDCIFPTTIVSPLNQNTVSVRRLSRLSLSAMQVDDDSTETDANSIAIPISSSSKIQYTHHTNNKLSTLAFSTSPTQFKRRNSSIDSNYYGSFVGSFEESLFSGRMSSIPSKPIMFHSQIGVLGYDCKPSLKCPPHWSILFPATYYKDHEQDEIGTPYVGTIDINEHVKQQNIGQLGYRIPPKGQLQIIIKNPNKTAIKLFLIPYNFKDMPKNTKTFLRQKSYIQGKRVLRFAIHLQFIRSNHRIYLTKTIRIVFSNQKLDSNEKFDVICEGPKEPVYTPI